MREHGYLRQRAISFNVLLEGSCGLQLHSLTGPTRASPPVKVFMNFTTSSTDCFNQSFNHYQSRKTSYNEADV